MSILTTEMAAKVSSSSMIRKMFEAGIELKKKFGDDNVYDFSLGNPDLPPPPVVKKALETIAATADQPFSLGYMPNAGFNTTREALAKLISEEQGVAISASNVITTCGAAGGLNVVFRAILERGDEVLCPSPYFVEYGAYTGNYGGILKPVPTKMPDFQLDVDAIARAVTAKTKAIILNSPNNPTGRIYTEAELNALGDVLRKASASIGHDIVLLSDEPYRFLNYDNAKVLSPFAFYDASIVVGSFSKTLSLAGERVGYLAVSPTMNDAGQVVGALTVANRILGYVNAPCIGQKIIEYCAGAHCDLEIYRQRRAAMAEVLTAAGVEYTMPAGAFYFFPKSPVEDETVFVNALFQERVLAVPGRGFGLPGYVRLAFCVSETTIRNSLEGFRRAVKAVRG